VSRNRSLELRPAAVVLTAGNALQLNLVVVTGPNRTELIPGHRARWVSSAPEIAEVTRQGRVSARSVGDAVITASYDGLTATSALTVT
jgi:uncharacterized protein YjdB